MDNVAIDRAKEHFGKLLEDPDEAHGAGSNAMPDWIDYAKLKPIRIGILAGDGIGPFIAAESKRVLEFLLKDEVKAGQGRDPRHRGPDHREPGRPQ